MPSRIASGPIGDSARWKSLLVGDLSIVEAGLRPLEIDLEAGACGPIDILAVDRAGQLTILHLSAGDPDGGLRRLLDQYLWAFDRFGLLSRAHASQGLSTEEVIRPLLLARSFSFPFLRRLEMLAVEVTPYLIQIGRFRGDEVVTVRPAVEVFGLPARHAPSFQEPDAPPLVLPDEAPLTLPDAPPRAGADAAHRAAAPARGINAAAVAPRAAFDPVAALTPDLAGDDFLEMPDPDTLPVVRAGAPGAFESEPLDVTSLMGVAFPGSLSDRFVPGKGEADRASSRPAGGAPAVTSAGVTVTSAGAAVTAAFDDIIEPLSPDELAEFVQFDRSRREREERSS